MSEVRSLIESTIPLVILAVLLVVAVWIIEAMGISPLLAGIIAIEMLALVWTERFLESRGVIKPQDRPLFYFGALASVILTWGLVNAGLIPIPSSQAIPMSLFQLYAVFTASFWGIIAFIILTLALGALYCARRAGYRVTKV